MEQRELGKTGLTVSALGFGCGAVGGLMVLGEPAEQRRAVQRALDAGITYFDTAASYGDGKSETNLGRVLKELNAWSRVVVGTKVRLDGNGSPRSEIRKALEQSLRRLDHDSVDIFHLHNPIAQERGLELDFVLGEVARGFEDVVAAGLTRHAGFTAIGQTAALVNVARAAPFETLQVYFNVLNPSAGFPGHAGGEHDFGGLIETAASAGRGVIVIRVLAAGAAAARSERAANAGDPGSAIAGGGDYAEHVDRARQLAPLAAEAGLEGPLELALRFGLSKPGVSTVLVGYSNQQQLEDAIRWAERGALAPAVVERVVSLA